MAHLDTYSKYEDLAFAEVEGTDFGIVVQQGTSGLVIVAPHAGRIEIHTSVIARAIAGLDHSLYMFEGLKGAGNKRLHITSDRFEEPRCMALVQASTMAVGVHGATGDQEFVIIGGRNAGLRSRLLTALFEFGATEQASPHLLGRNQLNICNRARQPGVQLEISRGLRNRLMGEHLGNPAVDSHKLFLKFVDCVRLALSE